MFSRSIGLLACALVATGANGFLIPPNLDAAASESLSDTHGPVAIARAHSIQLPCSTCAFAPKKKDSEGVAEADDKLWIQGGANNLLLDFTVSSDGYDLVLNGLPIFPFHTDTHMDRTLHVRQVAASTSRDDTEHDERLNRAVELKVTSHGVSIDKSQRNDDESEMMVALRWRLLEIENQPMEVDEVAIQLLKFQTGEILILSVEPLHEEHPPMPAAMAPRPIPIPPSHECGSLPAPVCRLVRILQDKADVAKHSRIGKLAGCAGRKGGRPHRLPGHIKGPHFNLDGKPHGPPFRHGPPRGMHPHGPHEHHGHHRGPHHGHHQFLGSFVSGFMAILTPVLTGLAIGLLYCAMFYVASRFTVWFWIRVVHRGKAPTSERTKRVLTALGYNEAKWFPVDEEAHPPVYEAPPMYELSEKNEQEAPLLPDVATPQL
nr:hypothetical protein B0A51_13172 [Rachicladosporium sp. CCFEE 5018]